MSKNGKNILIVGAGIAGATLAYQAVQRNYTVTLIHNTGLPCASNIAAGLYNPIVFKRLVPTWLASKVIPYAIDFYCKVEKKTGNKFHKLIPIKRIFTQQQEIDFWNKKITDPETNIWLDAVYEYQNKYLNTYLNKEAHIKNSGWVNVPVYLKSVLKYLQEYTTIIDKDFKESDLIFKADVVIYNNEKFDTVFFAQGIYIQNSKLFSNIKMVATKGDIFTIHSNVLPKDSVLNKDCFFIPQGNNNYIAGSTYNWTDNSWDPKEHGAKELSNKIEQVIGNNFKLLSHKAGIRPSTNDRRPVLGNNPIYKNVYVFNGLGTKGVLLAPFLANHLLNVVEGKEELLAEVNLSRYYKNK